MRGGKIVQTADGRKGKTKNSDIPQGNKVLVYLDSGAKILVRPEKLKIIGYWD